MINEFIKTITIHQAFEIDKSFVGVNGRLYCGGCNAEILESEPVWDVNRSHYTHTDLLCLQLLEKAESNVKK